jgi:hypothetical protein
LGKKELKMISQEAAIEMGKEGNATAIVECSALTQEGMKNVFDTAIIAIEGKKKNSSSQCSLIELLNK